MTEKIEWYKEVLELEPNSKVFLPLAHLYASRNEIDEAVAALEHGLSRHPEHMEARLFLIELLYKAGRQADCTVHVQEMKMLNLIKANVMARHLGFDGLVARLEKSIQQRAAFLKTQGN